MATIDMKEEYAYYTGEASFAPIAVHVSSPVIRPIDKGKAKSHSLETAREQAEQQMAMLRRQADVLMQQARKIEERLKLAEEVYGSDMGFDPVVGQTYHLYLRKNGQRVLSMIAPTEWGGRLPFEAFATSVRLLGDKTWEAVGLSGDATKDALQIIQL
ncbi:MAG: DUF2452 domain-containing protein [Sphingomonadales bacterium]|nr:DUF2452 domain-containing protein [Sphingomonadales bacterium]